MSFESWLAFCSISFIASFTPGPAILIATTHALQHGLNRSVSTMCGNITGLLIMASCSIAGLSAVILTSTLAFTVIKVAGAVYLFYLGIKKQTCRSLHHSRRGVQCGECGAEHGRECRQTNQELRPIAKACGIHLYQIVGKTTCAGSKLLLVAVHDQSP